MNIQDLKSNTTWQEASNTINNNNNKISLAIATLEKAKLKNKGYFTTLEKLNEAIPNPTVGSKAYVGTSEPYAIYIVENGVWVDSGYTGGDEIVAKITTERIEDGAVTSEKISSSAFDPNLSVSGKIAPADVVGRKINELEGKVDDLLPMSQLYKSLIPITGETKAGVVYSDNNYFTPNNSAGENLVFQVTAGVTYMISLTVASVAPTLGCVSFLSGDSYPTSNVYVDEIIKTCDALGAYETTYTPESNGYIIILQKYNNIIYSSSTTVKSPQYIDFQAEINEIGGRFDGVETGIASVENSLEDIKSDIYGSIETRDYNLTAGKAINTTSPHLIINTDIKANAEFEVTLAVTDQTKTAKLYLKKEDGKYDISDISTNQSTLINKDFKIIGVAFYIISPTENGIATLTVKTKGEIKDEIDKIPQIEDKITEVENSFENIKAEIFNTNYEREYNVIQGTGINTTSPNLRLSTDIVENQFFTVLLSSTEETKKCRLYFYKDSSKWVSEEVQLGKEVLLSKDYKIGGIGFYIPSPTADGTVILSVSAFSRLSHVDEELNTQKYYTQKLRLADAISAWANGEKFPIGWHGDSTTDGVSTTGWTTENSHPAQDEAAGGRGKADYICEKAYPYILEQMLKSEFNNENLRIYNIGYYGASLVNNYAQLEDIYSYAYSDVKMVGLSLSINDRGGYNTLSEFYKGVYDYLIKYVEFYKSKGIVPFMVLQQAVTQGGNNGSGVYNPLFQNYTQTLANKAKIEVAKLYGLEVIDMNSFGFTLLNASNYSHKDLSENLHFKDLGHKLEAEYLFSELVPWVEKTDERSEIYLGILSRCTKSDIALTGSTTIANPTSDKFKLELNFTKGDTSDKLIYEYYIFNNSGQYNLQYMTPEASGYIIHNGNRIEINSTVVNLGIVDIGLHKLQVYTGESNKVAFKGFKLVV